MALFAISTILLLLTAGSIVRWFPDVLSVRFWVFLAAVNLLLTSGHLVSSVFNGLTPAGFLTTQVALLAGTIIAAQLIGRRLRLAPGSGPRPITKLIRWPGWRSPICVILTLAVLGTLGLSLAEQMIRPITGFDERMYNCSRVLYWLQHRNIWPWATHNDAQIDFPIGSEVFFSWPLLFTREEWMGRLIYWLGYPCAICGIYLLTRLLEASRSWAMGAALLFATTPTVLYLSGINQKQDIWTAAMLLGVTYWIVRCWKRGDTFSAAMAGLFCVVAVNVKITTSVVAPLAVVALLAAGGGWPVIRRRFFAQAGGVSLALILSGLAVTMAQNLYRNGHPFGAPSAAKEVVPDFSVRQTYTHAVRAVLFMMEPPMYPTAAFKHAWAEAGHEALYRLDAHRALARERRFLWPGTFRLDDGPRDDLRAYKFSLGGMIFIAAVVFGVLRTVRRILIKKPALGGPAIAALVAAVQFAALVFLLRWAGGAPERYLVGPYAVGIAAACGWLGGRRQWWVGAAALMAITYAAAPSLSSILSRHAQLRQAPIDAKLTDPPFEEIVTKLPPGARIFLVCNRNAREYPLFFPRHDYPNQITPWGRVKFSEERLQKLVEENAITHAVFERDDRVGFHWYPGTRVSGMVDWFRARPDFREVPLTTPGQRLFERIGQ